MEMIGTLAGLGNTPTICTTAMVGTVRGAGTRITYTTTLVGSRGAGNTRITHPTTLVGSFREAGVLTADMVIV
jgi:hypothetical protein